MPCYWSKHKQQSIFAILTVFIVPMITDSMYLGYPNLSSQLLFCSLLLLQRNWFTREIDLKDWSTNLTWWGMNQTCSACSSNFLCNLISARVPCWAEQSFSQCRADLFCLLYFFSQVLSVVLFLWILCCWTVFLGCCMFHRPISLFSYWDLLFYSSVAQKLQQIGSAWALF